MLAQQRPVSFHAAAQETFSTHGCGSSGGADLFEALTADDVSKIRAAARMNPTTSSCPASVSVALPPPDPEIMRQRILRWRGAADNYDLKPAQ